MTNKLTPKQEKFCQLIFEGKTQTEAYRGAFNCLKMKPETVNNEAYKLLQRPHIAARIAELREKIIEKVLWSHEVSIKGRLWAAKKAMDAEDYKAFPMIADGLDKLMGITSDSNSKEKKEIERIEVVFIDPKV